MQGAETRAGAMLSCGACAVVCAGLGGAARVGRKNAGVGIYDREQCRCKKKLQNMYKVCVNNRTENFACFMKSVLKSASKQYTSTYDQSSRVFFSREGEPNRKLQFEVSTRRYSTRHTIPAGHIVYLVVL